MTDLPRPTDRDAALTATLRALEERLADPAARADAAAIAPLLADELIEIGASGAIYDRAAVLAALAAEAAAGAAAPIELADLAARWLAPDVALVTFRARTARGASWRTSIWARRGGAWVLVFHQGTPAP